MESVWTGREARFYRLGRHALLFGLRLLQISPGDAVLLPAFICRDLLAPINSVGAIPKFYDVDQRLQPVVLPQVPNVRAVVAVNYFGFPQDLDPFREYCLLHNAALIEDNAHGFLSRDSFGANLGERGDLGILSMRKTFPLPDGAALLVNNPDWRSRVAEPLPCRGGYLPLDYRTRAALLNLQRRTGFPSFVTAQTLIRFIRRLCTGQEVPLSDPASEYDMPANPAPHCRSLAMLATMGMADEVARRRALYEKTHDLLAKENIEPVFGSLPTGVAPYGYPFRADRERVDRVKEILRSVGMDCSHWPDLPTALEPIAPEHYRSVWLVSFV